MIEMTIHQFVVTLLGVLGAGGLMGYAIAALRPSPERSRYTTRTFHEWRQMSPEERAKFEEGWAHFGKGFDAMREAFERVAG